MKVENEATPGLKPSRSRWSVGRAGASVPALAAAVFFGGAVLASAAQSIQLEFRDGRVWLTASNASVRDILKEWARLGGATIVNGDAVAGAPVTLELEGMPERQALEVILSGVAGYVLTSRPARSAGSSAFGQIWIVPTSTSPPAPAPAVTARRPSNASKIDLPETLGALLRAAGVKLDDVVPESDLPEPLAALLGVTPGGDVDSPDRDGVEHKDELPEALVNILRSVTDPVTPGVLPNPPTDSSRSR